MSVCPVTTTAGCAGASCNGHQARPGPASDVQRTSVIRRWQRVGTLIKITKKKRSCTQTSSPVLLDRRRDGGTSAANPGARQVPPSRKLSRKQERPVDGPLKKFRRAVRLLQILLRVSNSIIRFSRDTHGPAPSSLGRLHDDLDGAGALKNSGLVFDPAYFKVKKEGQLGTEVKRILTKYPRERTPDEVRSALVALKNAVHSFGEFPIHMQESLASVGWYERFEANRVIIRQGRVAESFYLMLSGTSVVTIVSPDRVTSDPNVRTVAFLKRGNSFGELALMHHSTRQATVFCKGTVELLSIGREDFSHIFMHLKEGVEPDFIRYLRSLEELDGWPVHRLPYNDPGVCLFAYFRRGVVICKDCNKSEWIYFVKTGTCRVLKKVKAPKRLFKARADLMNLSESNPVDIKPSTKVSGSSGNSCQAIVASPEKRTRVSRDFCRSSRYTRLPIIVQQSQATSPLQCTELTKEFPATDTEKVEAHIKLIEEKMELLRVNPPDMMSSCGERAIFIQVQKLTERDTFGLNALVFGETEGAPSVTLVSEGAECILVSKRFFLQHLSEEHKESLRKLLRPFPSEERLSAQLQEQTDWDEFKCSTMRGLLDKYDRRVPLHNFTA